MSDKPKLLIVDDEPLIREILKEDFEYEGFDVMQAGGANEAKDLLAEHLKEIDVILSDIRMPHGNGLELLDHLAAIEDADKPKIIMMSGFSDAGEAQVLQKGALRLFKKPFDNDEIIEFIKSLL